MAEGRVSTGTSKLNQSITELEEEVKELTKKRRARRPRKITPDPPPPTFMAQMHAAASDPNNFQKLLTRKIEEAAMYFSPESAESRAGTLCVPTFTSTTAEIKGANHIAFTCNVKKLLNVEGHLKITITESEGKANILLEPVMTEGLSLHPATVRGIVEYFKQFGDMVGNFHFDASHWKNVPATEIVRDLDANGFRVSFLPEIDRKGILDQILKMQDENYAMQEWRVNKSRLRDIDASLQKLYEPFTRDPEKFPAPTYFVLKNDVPEPYRDMILARMPVAINW